MSDSEQIVIVGGGLAGMTAALELVSRGLDVVVFESSGRLGGKAGSDASLPLYDKNGKLDRSLSLPAGVASDHGYHVFPKWYTNMRHLWTRIGITDADVYEGMLYLDLPLAENGRRLAFEYEGPPQSQQVRSICDLLVQPDDRVEALTLQAFLQSRDYFEYANPISLNSFILNALTIGDADISSRACRNVFRQWLPVFTETNWDALRGSLDRVLIQRLHAAIERAADSGGGSIDFRFHHSLVGLEINNGAAKVTIEGSAAIQVFDGNPIVLAIPQEVLRKLADNQLYEQLPQLSRLHHLRSNPFTAIDVFFEEKLTGMQPEHFTLKGSPYGLTAFEISQHWEELSEYPGTVIQFVAANSRGLRGLNGSGFVQAMTRELQRYIPEVPDKVAFFVPHLNMDVPLFVNDVATWNSRPTTSTSYDNLYFAGDFCQNDTDVTSMEGAVRSGLNAAEALRVQYASQTPPVEIQSTTQQPIELQFLYEMARIDPTAARQGALGWFMQTLAAAQAQP